jgi:O-antigen/teichoic acid export membrane protein
MSMKANLLDHCRSSTVVLRRGLLSAVDRVPPAVRRSPLASTGLLSIFDQAVVSGTSFLTASIIGRASAPEQLGSYYLVLSVVLIASGLLDQVVTAPYVIYSKRRAGRELIEYTSSSWVHHFLWTALAVAGLLLSILFCWATSNSDVRPALWALLNAGPLLLLRETIRRFAFANLRLRSLIFFDMIVATVQLGGLAWLAYLGRLSLFNIYAVMGAACGLAAVIWYWLDSPKARIVRARLWPDWCENWAFGRWALRSYLVGSVTPQIMLWIVGLAVSAAATGVLGACTTLTGVANIFLLGISNILTPQAAQAYATGGRNHLRHVLLLAFAVLLVPVGALCLLAVFAGDALMVLVFGPLYQGSGSILFILTLSMLMVSAGTVAGNGLWAINRPRLNFIADVCCMSVTLLMAGVLVGPLGVLGAALATMAGNATAALVRVITLLRCLEFGVRNRITEVASAQSC